MVDTTFRPAPLVQIAKRELAMPRIYVADYDPHSLVQKLQEHDRRNEKDGVIDEKEFWNLSPDLRLQYRIAQDEFYPGEIGFKPLSIVELMKSEAGKMQLEFNGGSVAFQLETLNKGSGVVTERDFQDLTSAKLALRYRELSEPVKDASVATAVGLTALLGAWTYLVAVAF